MFTPWIHLKCAKTVNTIRLRFEKSKHRRFSMGELLLRFNEFKCFIYLAWRDSGSFLFASGLFIIITRSSVIMLKCCLHCTQVSFNVTLHNCNIMQMASAEISVPTITIYTSGLKWNAHYNPVIITHTWGCKDVISQTTPFEHSRWEFAYSLPDNKLAAVLNVHIGVRD